MSTPGRTGMRPAPGELLVEVRAAGLNRADLLDRRRGAALPGRELAGEVMALGDGVEGWSVGDRVMSRGSGFAAQAVVPAEHAMAVPADWSWAEAGALPIALMTMHDALVTHGQLRPGGRVLMHAATSGVGSVGCALAAALGASTIFATSRSAAKLAVLAQGLGDLEPCRLISVDTTSTAPEAIASDVDVVVDNVGASVLAANLAAVRIGGRIVQVGRLGGRSAELDLDELARKRVGLIGVTFRTRTDDDVTAIVRAAVADVGDRLGRLRPRVERVFPLAELDGALDALAANAHVGKLVVTP